MTEHNVPSFSTISDKNFLRPIQKKMLAIREKLLYNNRELKEGGLIMLHLTNKMSAVGTSVSVFGSAISISFV